MGGRNEQESEREREHRLQQTDKKQLRSPDTVRGLWPTCTGTEHTQTETERHKRAHRRWSVKWRWLWCWWLWWLPESHFCGMAPWFNRASSVSFASVRLGKGGGGGGRALTWTIHARRSDGADPALGSSREERRRKVERKTIDCK